MAMNKDKMVDKVDQAVSKVSPAYAADMDREKAWKMDDAMRDFMRVEGHKKDPEVMKGMKKRVKAMAKTMGC